MLPNQTGSDVSAFLPPFQFPKLPVEIWSISREPHYTKLQRASQILRLCVDQIGKDRPDQFNAVGKSVVSNF
jgi:hypothetical protein